MRNSIKNNMKNSMKNNMKDSMCNPVKTPKKIYALFTMLLLMFIFESVMLKNRAAIVSVFKTEIHQKPEKYTGTDNFSKTGNDTVPTQKKRIALTFDDGPHPAYTIKLLDGLKERNVHATFFVIGENACHHSEILKRMSTEGHLIGNHTYSHVQLTCIPEQTAIEEIRKTNDVIENATGVRVKYIRPPYGSLPKELTSETTLTPVLWTIDPRDWSVLNTTSVANHIVSRAKDGDIILLHDIFETSVDAAFIVIDKLQAEGFEFVTIEELLQSTAD